MKRLGFIFSLLLLFVSSVSAKVTVSDAQKIVKDYVEKKAGWKYDEVNVYQAPNQIQTVNISFGEGFSLSEKSWCFMIDPTPNMKWCHPCKYVCISPTSGTTTVKAKNMFPEKFNTWTLINRTPTQLKSFNVSTRFIEPGLFTHKKTNVVKNNAYAILISGGESLSGNWQDGWNEMSIMYQALTDLHGYKKSNITVLMSDGNNTGNDITVKFPDGTKVEMSSPTDLDGDNKSDVNYACNANNVKTAFENLAKKSTTNDDIFVYIVSHGGPDLVALYNSPHLYSYQLSAYLDNLKAKSITVFLSACHSGSFIDDIKGSNRTIITSTSKDESGYVFSNKCDIGTFWEPFFFALTGTDLKTNANYSCDANNDGKNDYEESFVNGITNDWYARISNIGWSHSTPHFWTSKSVTRSVNITAGSGRVMSGATLTANNTISNADITYQATNKVTLKKGFKYTQSGNAQLKCLAGGNCLRKLDVLPEIEDEVFEYEDFFEFNPEISDIDNVISEAEKISIYPNPTDGILSISVSNGSIDNIVVSDISGKDLMNLAVNADQAEIDLSAYNKGLYLVKVVTENDSYTEKIVLK